MLPNNHEIRRFCSKADIKKRAHSILFAKAWNAYKSAPAPLDKSCSYSLETGRFYEGDAPEDRKDLIELHGDGSTIYIIAPWSNFEETLRDEDAEDACRLIVSMGYIPFIGIWYFEGRRCEEPSFAVDHGIDEAEVKTLLEKFEQVAAYRVRYDCAETVEGADLEAGRQTCGRRSPIRGSLRLLSRRGTGAAHASRGFQDVGARVPVRPQTRRNEQAGQPHLGRPRPLAHLAARRRPRRRAVKGGTPRAARA